MGRGCWWEVGAGGRWVLAGLANGDSGSQWPAPRLLCLQRFSHLILQSSAHEGGRDHPNFTGVGTDLSRSSDLTQPIKESWLPGHGQVTPSPPARPPPRESETLPRATAEALVLSRGQHGILS